ncbi:MAG: hypothetical protein ABIT38_13580, partial [Gemmatimonadaceae bacterium]
MRLDVPVRFVALFVAMMSASLITNDVAAAQDARVPRRLPASSPPASHFVDSLLATLSLDEKLGQLTQVSGQGTPTGPKVRTGGEAEINSGRVGSFLGVFGADYTRQLQKVAVEQSTHHIPLLFSHDVIHG